MRRERAWPLILIVIAVAAALARLAVIAPLWGRVPNDPDLYLPLARSLATGHGFALWDGRPTAYRPPLYPLFLAPWVWLLGSHAAWAALWLNVALGCATVVLTALTARRWGLGGRRALLAAAIVALDPVLVSQSRGVMTETFAAALVALTLALAAQGSGVGWISVAGGGLGFGLAALCRPSLLPAAVLGVLAAVLLPPGSARRRVVRGGVLAAVVLVVLAPWALRNRVQLGEAVWTTTHGGYTLFLANNATYYDEVVNGPPGAVWSGPGQDAWFRSIPPRIAGASGEPEADRLLRDSALRVIRERPGDFSRAAWARLTRFWALAPAAAVYSPAVRIVSALWSIPLGLAVAWGLTRRSLWRWPCVLAPLFLIALTVVHIFFWSDLRMRAPLVPALALIAAGAALGSNLGVRSEPAPRSD